MRGRPSVTQNRSATDQSGMTVLFTVGHLVMPARAFGPGGETPVAGAPPNIALARATP